MLDFIFLCSQYILSNINYIYPAFKSVYYDKKVQKIEKAKFGYKRATQLEETNMFPRLSIATPITDTDLELCFLVW